jgi:hypothetical protein
MTPEELISEGQAIAKRCFVLSTRGTGAPAGYWGGSRSDIADAFPLEVTKFTRRRHIVSVGESLLALVGAEKLPSVSLYEWFDQEEESYLHVERGRPGEWSALRFDGDPLYATERTSFPPFEALCLHGSEQVAAWLSSLGLARHQYWRVPRDVVQEYERHYVARVEEIRQGADAIVGGWHEMWPEDDYYMPAEMTYVLKTLRDAEPWYTVWHSPMSKACFARIHVS